ncbi:MAG: DNA helicase [Pseudomonadota bacterium]
MHLSTPIYRLKRQAKLMSRQAQMPLHQALDRLAVEEGFQSWSHLSATAQKDSPAERVLNRLRPGDLALLAARPGHGKTLLALEVAARAQEIGRKGFVFTLEYTQRDVEARFAELSLKVPNVGQAVEVGTSDEISAAYILDRLAQHSEPAVIVIDYLQLLDQTRSKAALQDQIRTLHSFVKDRAAMCLVISQIDRRFDEAGKAFPDVSDIRLPNPVDLSLFNPVLLLHDGALRIERDPDWPS